MILAIDGDPIMVIGSPTRYYKRNVMGIWRTHLRGQVPWKIKLPSCKDRARERISSQNGHIDSEGVKNVNSIGISIFGEATTRD